MIASDLITKYGGPVPRYTSYPTAPHFHAGVDARIVHEWLQETVSTVDASVYIHMAYCKQLCLYCGCNMKVTHNPDVISDYVSVVLDEMRRVARLLPARLRVGAIHLGGGTPSYCPMADLERTFAVMCEVFEVREGADISMEIDPRQLVDGMPELLGKLGFNRASLGIQDTNLEVQKVIRRVQPHAMNVRAVALLRAAGVRDINVDLLYGLPLQTVETMKRTVDDVMELRPQRIALFGYAHVPWMKKHQAVLEQHSLPDGEQRMAIFDAAVEALTRAGYMAVGIDHFCLPDDPMAVAACAGDLHRNFMGYTTDAAPVLLGFGASAISQYGQGYAQNVTSTADYTALVRGGHLPIARGITVNAHDVAQRGVIEQLLCGMRASGPALESLLVNTDKLREMVRDELVEWRDGGLQMTAKGRPFVRAVASCFDAYIQQDGRYSRAV